MNRYAIVTGQGRSGTNWVLDILDASRQTLCRNEPNVIPGSPFERLGSLVTMSGRELLDEKWDGVVKETCTTLGERDHRLKTNKEYLHTWAHKAGLPPLIARPKFRSALGKTVLPSLGGPISELPLIFGSRERLDRSFCVIKVNRVPLLVDWLLSERPDVPVVNIVRHPCGRHASFMKRYLASADVELELERARQLLHEIADLDPVWKDRFTSIDSMSHAATQTWLWRYVNETIEESGAGREKYMQIIFEDMTSDPMPHARAVYDLMGLDWTPEVERNVEQGLQESVWGKLAGTPEEVASAWKKSLSAEHVEEIEAILAQSPLASNWA